MKVKVNKDLIESIAEMSVPSAALLFIWPPLAIVYAITFGTLLHNSRYTEAVEIEINPLEGIMVNEAKRQYEDYIHHLRQMAAFGMPKNQEKAKELLVQLGLKS